MISIEELKAKEAKVNNARALASAKKQTAMDAYEKKIKLEEECKTQHNITLQEIPEKIIALEKEKALLFDEIEKGVSEIESAFEKIK